MKSYDIQVLNATNPFGAPPRRQWAKPSVEIIPLESAESGFKISPIDGSGGGHYSVTRS